MNEQQVIDTTQVTLDYCKECDAVVKSDQPCEHSDLEWLNFVEW